MEDDWFAEIAKRCPWNNKMTTNLCQALETWSDCKKNNCAPFFMAATIISAYKDDENKNKPQTKVNAAKDNKCNCKNGYPMKNGGCFEPKENQ